MVDYNPPNPARHKSPKPVLLPQAIGHHTPAVRTLFGRAVSVIAGRGGRKRRKARAAPAAGVRRRRKKGKTRTRRARKGAAHLVKGSQAAKSHMAKLRRMVGKK